MHTLLPEIRARLNVSQEELARMIGVSFATVNRWENGHSRPNKAVQLRLYDICKEHDVNLEEILMQKIQITVSGMQNNSGRIILYHGSKSGIYGPIAPISRDRCDFGKGFYMGTDPYQPLTLIRDFEHSRFYVLDNFFLGNITDKAPIMSLSALQLGQQYVAITEKACQHVAIEAEIELSYLEKIFLRDLSEANRVKGINLANGICRDYRREGLFFDEILRGAIKGGSNQHG